MLLTVAVCAGGYPGMSINRRQIIAGIAGLGASTAIPALAQTIRRQSQDPWAQVDPYADPRNGQSPYGTAAPPAGQSANPPKGAVGQDLYRVEDPDENLGGVSEAEEIEMGRQGLIQALNDPEEARPLGEPRLQAALQNLVSSVARHSLRPNLPWKAVLLNDISLNAAAFMGGFMVYNVGAIRETASFEEFLSIVAHEMGHVEHRHQLRKGMFMNAVNTHLEAGGNIAKGAPSAGVFGRGAEKAGYVGMLLKTYSRNAEYEADENSMKLISRMGGNPFAAVRMLEKLGRHSSSLPLWLRTHPLSEDRIAQAKNVAASLPAVSTVLTSPHWDLLKSALS